MLVVARKPRFQRENSGFRATTCFGGGCRASNDARLEREEVADLHVEGVGDTAEVVETHAHASRLDAPDVRFAAADHEGELLLRQALRLPSLANRALKALFSYQHPFVQIIRYNPQHGFIYEAVLRMWEEV